jgi:hypothetical protein
VVTNPVELRFSAGAGWAKDIAFTSEVSEGERPYCKFDVALNPGRGDVLVIDPGIILQPGP